MDAYIRSIRFKRELVQSFRQHPFDLPWLGDFHALDLHPKVTFFVGENGSGKSTLLEAIAVAWGFNPEGGSKNFRFSTEATHSHLHEFLTLVKGVRRPKDGFFLRAESFYNVATEVASLGVGAAYGEDALHEQSHGESFMSLVTHRFRGKGLYILDEPEAALSPSRQLSLLSRLHDLVRDDSQIIIATHSPILMAYPDAWIYTLGDQGLERVQYEDTEHFRITRDFLKHPERFLRQLLEP
ncbi:AAA family ATPase [Ahniella affigens]|uniref:AAA family ATPase n=1 Tax=Ahniella affigens TaxID=2021234 RepID=A0A2P1PMZ8_9GAMM|nr:AAA family ATPase [Ahniella affigens]AVP96197.1 AAA family ATPase [Ahniella affigens]